MSEATIGVLGVFILGFVAGIVFWHWMGMRKERSERDVGPQIQVPAAGFDSTSEPKSKVCADCGCLVEASKTLQVLLGDQWSRMGLTQHAKPHNVEHFCKRCKPPYDRKHWEITITPDGSSSLETFHKFVPEHEIRVNKDGSEWKGPDEGGDAE